MKAALRETYTNALNLLVFSLAGATILILAYNATHAAIKASETASKQALLAQTLPQGSFDNDLVREARPLPADPLLGLKRPAQSYPARMAGKPVGVVLEAIAPDGYSGEIRLLVGVLADGRLSGVRVTAHRETPGLGDYIEAAKGNWIQQFTGKSLSDPAAEGWKVKKDGGRFDYAAGATITPRAVVKAVHGALRYFEMHRAELLALPPGGEGGQGAALDGRGRRPQDAQDVNGPKPGDLRSPPSVGLRPIPRDARDRNFVASCALRAGPQPSPPGGGGRHEAPQP